MMGQPKEAIAQSLDAFLGGRLMVAQPKTGYRAGIDAVFLAACAPTPRSGACRVLDVGAGVGTVGLCIAARCPDAHVVLLEREAALWALARDNIGRNGLEARVFAVHGAVGGTIGTLANDPTTYDLVPDSFDHAVANPPFHAQGRGTPAPDALKAASHAMPEQNLDDWLRFMARMVKPGGTATVIHKADGLPAVLAAFAGRFGDLAILPLHPRAGEPAGRVVVQGVKGSRAPARLLAGFVLHDNGHTFTPQAQTILREGEQLALRRIDASIAGQHG